MRTRLRKAWESRAPRERRALTLLAGILGITTCLWLIVSVDEARIRLRSGLPGLRAQAGGLEQQAAEYARIKIIPSTPSLPGELRSLVRSQADAAGLSHAVSSIDPLANDQIQVIFSSVPFADWLDWVVGMQLQHVRLETGRIEALPESGRVKVTAIFARSTGGDGI